MAKTNLGEKLRVGDYSLIAEMTGYALSTVWQQLNNERTLTNKVKRAALKVIKSREKLLNQK